jgi:hypothetical protein
VTLAQVLASSFLGAGGAASWRQHLARTAVIASGVNGYEVTPPDGLERLESALARYSTSSAS